MRSWNVGDFVAPLQLPKKFAIYQWGVETKPKRFIWINCCFVRNLPMRSWNSCLLCNLNSFLVVRNLPMRSWNPYVIYQAYLLQQQFAIYQWGVETNLNITKPINESFVRNLPMRSWNSSLSAMKIHSYPRSQFTNEELKPKTGD